jgi:thiol-disulfide isomerase/thioredoxin
MTIRVLTCWALCAALVSADDKKAEEPKKPATAAEAVTALAEVQKMRPRSAADRMTLLDKMVASADAVLAFKDASSEQKDKALSAKATALFSKSMLKPDTAKDFEEFAKKVEADHPKSAALGTIESIKFRKKHIAQRPTKVEPAVVEELLELAKKYPKETTFAQIYATFAGLVKRADGEEKAIKFLEDGAKVFANDERIAGMLANMKVMGKPMDIVGPTLEGSEFNISSMKGKVVLVDFWATWCGPCIRELPNVKSAYEKHHGKGFEIVAVSFDFTRAPLEKFVKEKELPWTQIVFSKEEDMGWSNPIGKKYGINSIPATFLIGRDGKVVARDLRGTDLEKAVAAELAKSQKVAN